MKTNLDYLLDDPATCQVWVDFKICKTNPMHDDYLRYDSVEITLEQASKIASAKCNSVVLEFPGGEYTLDWNDNPMPELETTKVRMWNSQAWAVMNQRREMESAKIAERTRRLELVIDYFMHSLGRTAEVSRAYVYDLPPKAVDSLVDMAESALLQRQTAIAASDDADASAIVNGIIEVDIDYSMSLDKAKAEYETALANQTKNLA